MLQRAPLARPAGGRLGRAHLRRHAADAGDDARHARRDRAQREAVGRIAAPPSWSSAASPRSASICAGSTRGRCSASASSSRGRASRRPSWSRCSRRAGAEPIEAPMIRIAPPEDYGPLDAACARVGEFDWIVFSSANAVDAFIERLLASPLDLRALKGVKLCAVGPATAERLARHGLKVDLVPAEYRAEALVAGAGGLARHHRRADPAAARRHRPRGHRRGAAPAAAPTSPRSSPTGRWPPNPSARANPTSTGCCSIAGSTS